MQSKILQAYDQCVDAYPCLGNIHQGQSIDPLRIVFDLTDGQENAGCKWKQQICRLFQKSDTLLSKFCACRSHLSPGPLVINQGIIETRFM